MKKFSVESSIWINQNRHSFVGKGRIEMLKLIDETGSLSKAAKVMKMSYKAAWDAINDINAASDTKLVERTVGGKNGGGSVLTPAAHFYIKLYDKIYDEQRQFFNLIEDHIGDYDKAMKFLARNSVRTSARNQIHGKITEFSKEGLMTTVSVDVEGIIIKALVTTQSVLELGLEEDLTSWLIFKSSWVEIADKNASGENVFEATLKSAEQQDKTVENTLVLDNGTVLINSCLVSPNLPKVGSRVKIFIDKTNIILGL